MRLIDADKLSSEMEFVFENARGMTALAARLVWAFIEKADTVDNVAQKKGHWIFNREEHSTFTSVQAVCSECGEPCASYGLDKPRDRFCKMCGADMRESSD